jgi:hypothetical protein
LSAHKTWTQYKSENLDQNNQDGRESEAGKKSSGTGHSQRVIFPEFYIRFTEEGNKFYSFQKNHYLIWLSGHKSQKRGLAPKLTVNPGSTGMGS